MGDSNSTNGTNVFLDFGAGNFSTCQAAQAYLDMQGCPSTSDMNGTGTTTVAGNTTSSSGCVATPNDQGTSSSQQQDAVLTLNFLTEMSAAEWLEPIADRYNQENDGRVIVKFHAMSFPDLFSNIIDQASTESNLYDGFVTPPTIAGSIVEYDGWQDLAPYIQSDGDRASDWADILLGYRQSIATYQGQTIMYPLDGDILSLYYRADVLEYYNLTVPRTWDEYNAVAKAVHGRSYENSTLIGSCVGRVKDFAGPYWANLVISSMTQTQGQFEGHLFSTVDLKPLTGPAIVQALEWMEGQVKYGMQGEFEAGFTLNIDGMNSGDCVLTYNWGNSFKQFMKPGSQVAVPGRFKVAPTPGSRQVLDRDTMQLVDCTAELCPHGSNYSDIGWVNRAPYLAFGGWACAVNNYTDAGRKAEATKLCSFASSKQVSMDNIIPLATGNGTLNGQDPYRSSHLNATRYEQQGYEVTATNEYLKAIKSGLDHPNAVIDIRFPTASDINGFLDHEFHDHLNATLHGMISPANLPAQRSQLAEALTVKWQNIIQTYDALPTTKVPILEIEQKLRGVYSPPINNNQIDSIRIYGYVGIGLIYAVALASIAWTLWYKKMKVVRASQPFFLVMICFGAVVFGSVIIPFSMDDSIASVEACSKACMSIPWLVFLGWSILFSALFAKIWRVNLVYKNSMKFRRLTVSETDVLRPFAVLFVSNVTLLTVWTVLDPLTWTRVMTSPLDSYGTCAAGDSVVWIVCVSLLAVLNGAALFLANFQAYRARNLSTEYGESKYIGMAMACILQVTIVGVPLLFLVTTNPSADYFVRCTIVIVICMSILLLIFVPKMWHLYRNRTLTPLHRSTTNVSGLTFLVLDKNAMLEQEARIRSFKQKLAVLKDLLHSEGLDADALMEKAGLTAAELKISTVLADSKVESYPGSSNRMGTGGITASSGAESLVSIQRSSGVDTDDDNDTTNMNGSSYSASGKRVSFVNNQNHSAPTSRNVSIEEGEYEEDDSSVSESPAAAESGDEGRGYSAPPQPPVDVESPDFSGARLEI